MLITMAYSASDVALALKNQLEATVSNIDRVIFQLSDAAHGVSTSRKRSLALSTVAATANIHDEAPPGLEKQFQELYSNLHPFLVKRQRKSNVTALIMGLRGCGKTLLLERCLAKCQREADESMFRIIRLNGLVIRGDDVSFAVKEIVRQLSDMAMTETRKKDSSADSQQDDVGDGGTQRKKARKQELDMEKLLRLRNSSFTNNLALLDEALKTACVDSIPILIVLDELDAFLETSSSDLEGRMASEATGSCDRQLLLYHLLDRVATQGSFISLVGITSHLAAVGMFEKRVKSRAEGTSKVIYVRPHTSYKLLVQILLSKFHIDETQEGTAAVREEALEGDRLRKRVSDILNPPTCNQADGNDVGTKLRNVLERNFKVGKDVRWFSRVLAFALSLYLEDCNSLLRKLSRSSSKDGTGVEFPQLEADHFNQSLVAMGVFLPGSTTRIGESKLATNPRVRILLDLSGPQLAVLLSARRILARDSQDEDTPKPLTMERVMHEYQTYRGNSNRYGDSLIHRSFVDLLEMDVMRPSADHTGGGPLQYDYSQSYYAMDTSTMTRMPLHVPVDLDRELGEALKSNMLDCSTALREWGRKMN